HRVRAKTASGSSALAPLSMRPDSWRSKGGAAPISYATRSAGLGVFRVARSRSEALREEKRMSRPRLLLVSIILPLIFAATASAQTVEHGVEHVDVTTLLPLLSNACGFPLYGHVVGTNTFTDFLDDNGLIVKEITHVDQSVAITNLANGKTTTAERRFNVTTIGQDLFGPNEVVYSITITGADYKPFTIPGLGNIAQATG